MAKKGVVHWVFHNGYGIYIIPCGFSKVNWRTLRDTEQVKSKVTCKNCLRIIKAREKKA